MGSIGANKQTVSAYKEMSYQYDWNNKANSMRTYTYNGKEIETNAFNYASMPVWDYGDALPKGYETKVTINWKSDTSVEDAFNKLIEQGYDKIRRFTKKTGLNHFTNTVLVAGHRRK